MPAADAPVRRDGPTRPFPRVLVMLAVALLLARIATAVWEARRAPGAGARTAAGSAMPPLVAGPEDRVRWVPAEIAPERARASGRPVLYDFTADWCPPCRAMKRAVFADAGHAARIEQLVVPVRVLDRAREEGRNRPEVDSLQRAFGIEAFPTLVVARPGTTRFEKLEGYHGAGATLDWLARVADGGEAR